MRTQLFLLLTLCISSSASAQIRYVDGDALPGGNGLTWESAYRFLQDALAESVSAGNGISEIRIAQGIYQPDRTADARDGTQDIEASFELINGLALRGGYVGKGTTDPDERDITRFETVLSGDLLGDDGPNFANRDDNCRHVVTCDGSDETAVLDGVTIKGGNAPNLGGGMFMDGSSPTLLRCSFIDNQARLGGGIYTADGNASLTECRFVGNRADFGGGLRTDDDSHTILRNCLFVGNTAQDYGGGLYVGNGCNPTLTNCLFTGNSADEAGAILNGWGTSPTFVNCTIVRNVARRGGGMLNSSFNTEALLSNCILWHNADLGGQDESAQIHNDFDAATVVNHSAVQEWSGTMEGVGNITEAPLFVDADGQDNIAGNLDDDLRLLAGTPGVDGGDNGAVPQGVVVDLNGQARFVDDPAATDSGQGTPPVVDMGAYEYQADCNANGICDSEDITDETSFDCNQNNIPDECEPECNGNGFPDDCDITEAISLDCNDNGQPDECEPECNENGVPDDCDIASGYSADDNNDGIPDECESNVLYVDDDAPDGGSGVNWATALNDLQAALSLAANSDGSINQIWVATGTYKPDSGTGDPHATFQLLDGVTVYGGFDGTEENLQDRAGLFNRTILSGDLLGNDSPDDPYHQDNSRHIVTSDGVDSSASLDGFRIVGGGIGIGSTALNGGGFHNFGGTPTVRHCMFDGNASYGGAVFNDLNGDAKFEECVFVANQGGAGGAVYNYRSSPVYENCLFEGNTSIVGAATFNSNSAAQYTHCQFRNNAAQRGGAVFNQGPTNATPVFVDCLFKYNQASQSGGAVYNISNAEPTFHRCAFLGNQAAQFGGAFYSTSADVATLINCLLHGNVAETAGALYSQYSPTELANCTVVSNMATAAVGGIYSFGTNSMMRITGCTVWSNSDASGSGESSQVTNEGETLMVNFSSLQGWTGDLGGIGNIADDPMFADPDGPDDDPDTLEDNDYRLSASSPCIDAADNTAVPEGIVTDLDGNLRFVDDPNTDDTGFGDPPIVDMGPYEFQPADFCIDDDGDGKVTICHAPPGNPGNARTIEIGVNAIDAHLTHGDSCGPCDRNVAWAPEASIGAGRGKARNRSFGLGWSFRVQGSAKPSFRSASPKGWALRLTVSSQPFRPPSNTPSKRQESNNAVALLRKP